MLVILAWDGTDGPEANATLKKKCLCGPTASAALVAGLLSFPLLASLFGWLKVIAGFVTGCGLVDLLYIQADYLILRRTIAIDAASVSSMRECTEVTCRRGIYYIS